MFCRKCGNQLLEEVNVCGHCNFRLKEAVFCRRCAAELPANATRCISCNAKSRAHKRFLHWVPLILTVVAVAFFIFGGYYYVDAMGVHNYNMPYTTALDYLALLVAGIAILLAIVAIPRTRLALKIVSILLSGIMIYLCVDWILYVVL